MFHAKHHAEVTFEDLENRTLMSAAPLHEVAAAVKAKVAVTVVAKHAATAVKTTTTPALVVVADPRTTDASITYRSFASDPLFASGGPTINDVSQGEVGDCYLLATLSSVAKTDPALIRKLVVDNGNGTFTVKFGVAGLVTKTTTSITVNADLPVLNGSSQVAYAQLGAQNSLWVAVVEKAYADYVNPKADAYATISGGWMGDVFTALGLKSQNVFASGTALALSTLIQRDLKGGDFVTMGTKTTVATSNPLLAGHAYEIDSVTVDAKGVILSVTLRNPWGNDLSTGGYVTVTAGQVLDAFAGLAVSHA